MVPSLGDHHIAWMEIPVSHAGAMQVSQGDEHLLQHAEELKPVEHPPRRPQRPCPNQQLCNEPQALRRLAVVEVPDHMSTVNGPQGVHLTTEPGSTLSIER